MAEPACSPEPYRWLNALATEPARAALTRCCSSQRWVEGMLARRPFGSGDALFEAANSVWSELDRADYLEAFAGHPQIGGALSAWRDPFASTSQWASQEQHGVTQTDERTLLELQAENRNYLQRFGFIFIICATGKTAAEMLVALRARLSNELEMELHLAAAEQAKITALRLEKLGT